MADEDAHWRHLANTYGPADATATPSSLASLKPDGFTFLVPAYLQVVLEKSR